MKLKKKKKKPSSERTGLNQLAVVVKIQMRSCRNEYLPKCNLKKEDLKKEINQLAITEFLRFCLNPRSKHKN